MTTLLDGNVLVALTVGDHVHHRAAVVWRDRHLGRFATTPTTQGTLLRTLIRGDLGAAQAMHVLDDLWADPRHDFWPDDEPYTAAVVAGVIGHRQVTDAYLAAQARRRRGRLATFDRGLAAQHPDVAELVPT